MRKIAIISDIHGNLPALKAVLKDIETEYKTDEIYCLGDLVDAVPWHNEVVDIIREKQIPTIMGNHDERIAINSKVVPMPKHTKEETNARISAIRFTKDTITQENKEFLTTLPATITIKHAEISCQLVHGSPNGNKHYIFEDHEISDIAEWFRDSNSDIILSGHTHLSYIKSLKVEDKERMWINVGSVGRSKEKIGGKAVYLWLNINDDGKVYPTLRKIEYNVQAAIDGIIASPVPYFYANFFEKHLEHK